MEGVQGALHLHRGRGQEGRQVCRAQAFHELSPHSVIQQHPGMSSVSYPYSFDTDPDPAFWAENRSASNPDPDPDPIRIRRGQKIKKILQLKKKIMIKNYYLPILRPQ